MTKRRVQLKWMSYQEDMRDLFCKLRETEDLTDIIVSNGSKNIKCHRIILSSACKIFYDLMKEHSGDLVIYLGSVHTSDMTSLVDFMYSGVVNVRQDRLSEFLALAKQWGVRGLGMDGAGDKAQAMVTSASSAAAPGASGQGEPAPAAAKRRRPAVSSDSSSEDEDSDAGAAARCPPAAGLSSAVLSVVNTDAAQKGKKGVTNIPSRGENETTVTERQRVKKATTTTPQRFTENIPDMFACPHCPRIFIKPHYFTTHKIKEHGDHTPISKHRVLMERGQANSTGAEVLSGGLKLRLPSKKKKKRSDEEEEKSREDESGRVDREKEREDREKERKDQEKEREAREKEREETARVNRERERKDREKEREDREKEREAREKEREAREKEREEAARVNRERERKDREREERERKRVEAARKAEQVRALAKKQAALAAAARAAAEESSSDSSDSEPTSRPTGKSAHRVPASRGRDRAPAASVSAGPSSVAAHGPSSSDTALPQRQTGSGGSSAQEVHMKPESVKEELPLPADTEERIVSYHSSDRDQARQSTTSSLSPHRRGPGGASERPSARVAPSRLRYDSPTSTQKQSSSQLGQRIVFDENGEPRPWVGSGENSAEPDLDFLSRPPPGVHGSSRSRVQEDDPGLFMDRGGQVDRGGHNHSGGRPGRGRAGRGRARWRGHGPNRGRGGDWEAGRERTTPPQNRGGSNTNYIWVRDEYKRFGYSDHQGGGDGFWEQQPGWSGF